MRKLAFICALLVASFAFSACGHKGGGSSSSDAGGNLGGIGMEGDPALAGSQGAVGVTTIKSQDDSESYTMIISFGSTPLGTLQADVNAYQMSNGLSF